MKLVQCPNGHFYNAEISEKCPVCFGEETDSRSNVWNEESTIPLFSSDDEPTQPMFFGEKDWSPVVGWLVCIKGEARGRDYRIHSERNFVGRSGSMDVSIYEDDKIAMDNHCSVVFDPKSRDYLLVPDKENITYYNGETLEHVVKLKAHDTFTIGDTTLEMVPYCGKETAW